MSNLRFVEKLASAPWMCDPEHVEFLHSIFLGYMQRMASGQKLDVRAVEQEFGRPLDNTREASVKDGVARIPVEGTIVRRASLFTEISGGVSTETIARDFTTAYNDSTVHSILFVFDTPGGEAHGIGELADVIRQRRDEGAKRVEAYCDGQCASAGYFLASACEWITVDARSQIGSIGTVVRVANPKAAARGEAKTLEFWNARSPKKRIDPNSYEGQEAIQEWIDDMGDEFIAAVASNRGVSFEKVVQDFGRGFIMTGRRAVEAGMADALGSEGEVVARLQRREMGERTPGPRRVAAVGAAKTIEEVQVAEKDTKQEVEAKGLLARLGAMLGVVGDVPAAVIEEDVAAQANADKGGVVQLEVRDDRGVLVADNGETLEVTDEVREKLASDSEGVRMMRAENEGFKEQVSNLSMENEALSAENQKLIKDLAEERADNELSDFMADGAPKYLADLAREDLVAAQAPDASVEANARAEKWRQTLRGSEGAVEYGERGMAGSEPVTALARANAKARELMASDPSLTPSQARTKVWEANPDLAEEYENEREVG